MQKYYRIAGLSVQMNAGGKTDIQAEPYRIYQPENIDITITTDGSELLLRWPEIEPDLAEYLATGAQFYCGLLAFLGMMLHSSAVVVDGRAYLFTADPGTGKSTHTSLWLKQFGDRAFILNDDKPAVRYEDGVWYAYGTPWSGKHDISKNVRAPIAGIAALEQAESNSISLLTGREAVFKVMKQVNKPKEAEYRAQLLKVVDMLVSQVPIWRLKCNMDPEAAVVSYEAMSGQKFVKEN